MRIPSDEEIDRVFNNKCGGCTTSDRRKEIRALYEGDPMQAHIGKLCEFSNDGKDWTNGKYYLEKIINGKYWTISGTVWEFCRPYYCLQMIPHDGRELPRYEQRCLVKWWDGVINPHERIISWKDVDQFLPITATGEVDYDAIEARGWEG